jgi:hypothetical protein
MYGDRIGSCLQTKIERPTQLSLISKATLIPEVESSFSFSFWIYISIKRSKFSVKGHSVMEHILFWYGTN